MKLDGLSAELYKEIVTFPVIDCHEHLPSEAERLGQRTDVTRLFSHYCKADLSGAGVPMAEQPGRLFDTSQPLAERWAALKPALERIRFGSYAYPAFAYVRDVLGFDDINDETFEAISERMQADTKPGFYKRCMVDLCGIETAIQCVNGTAPNDQDFFVYLCRDLVCSPQPRRHLELETNRCIHSLDAWVDALHQYVADCTAKGAVGYKIGAAYERNIAFDDVSRADAERLFIKLHAGVSGALDHTEREVLENYLMRRAVEACIASGIPVVIHTGYQSGVHNDIRNARATHLWSLLRDYPRARFDLFHGSFPYVEDMTVLGKYFENVSLNMCWMHIMSPQVARTALAQWLDAIPVHRIFAFGGDYQVVEKIYGHLKLARADVAMVLAEKVGQGRMTEADALHVAHLLFYDNPRRWYELHER